MRGHIKIKLDIQLLKNKYKEFKGLIEKSSPLTLERI